MGHPILVVRSGIPAHPKNILEIWAIRQDYSAKIIRMKSATRYCVLLLSLVAPFVHAQIQEQPNQSIYHGTVNVILANGHTLVAATDSMLAQGARRTPNGVKLYKIDDRTVATMANFYKESGPTGDDSLTASIPQMILMFSHRASKYEHMPFSSKADALFSDIKFELDRHLHTMIANNPRFLLGNQNLMLELTVAGYDVDNSIKIAEIILVPGNKNGEIEYISTFRPFGRYTPSCAFTAGFERLPEPYSDPRKLNDNGPVMFSVRDAMFCEIAGLRNIPEQLLASPANYPDDLALQGYVRARSEMSQLSAAELRALAIDLVDKTTSDERRTRQNRVGGEVEVAVLSDGRMIEEPKPVVPNEEGSSLNGSRFKIAPITCNSTREPFGPNGYMLSLGDSSGIQEIEITLMNCNQELDGFIFLNSTFIDSHLTYSGKTSLFFPDTNVVKNTTLEIGTGVDLHNPTVHDLICKFHWKSVYQGTQEVKSDCHREGKQ
jgi:hypothetical protein